ncbi:DUF2167 domain-containing protein [Luteimonas sp. SJ-92]|uniref:DUF2167 domain-containing protein n=1 Tax=Luteimonas salinisoli TaxID=2752307 RepID=A0A853JFX9_9GAMM|nr:DUF2167 domain-containing protein [Luteimonas salinisoli]NZA27755.1 DUF2167 domain-containing protein [Luteimonas salinisoli]
MRYRLAAALAAMALLVPLTAAFAQDDPIDNLPWQHGPTTGEIAGRATIQVPEGYAFLDAEGTRALDELLENPATDADQYTVAPNDLEWIAFFAFNAVGYVQDDEDLDAAALLASVREGTEHSNIERRRRGWDTLRVVGWSFEPKYDEQINALEWAILAESESSKTQVVNYNTRLLGRRGAMEVTVVAEPESLAGSIADFKRLMPGYGFASGETYAEFRPGDHVAEIGLAALITGGAAAVASKKGFFAAIAVALAKFWKLVLVGIVAVGVALRKLFGKRAGGHRQR